jgi:hypothetical protein
VSSISNNIRILLSAGLNACEGRVFNNPDPLT